MPSAKITSKGQVTIPQEIREALGLRAGDRVAFRLKADGTAVLEPENVELMKLCGIFKPKVHGVTVDAMNEAVARAGAGEE